jgi:hypothetical protein
MINVDGPVFSSVVDRARAIDPIGLQALNLRLYTTVFPGFNNVTQYVRVFSAFAWMLSRIEQAAYEENAVDERALAIERLGLEKMELLLTWSNVLAKVPGMPGALRAFPDVEDKNVNLRFDELLSYEAEVARAAGDAYDENVVSVCFMHSVQYLPALASGLRFIVPGNGVSTRWELSPAGKLLADAYQTMLDATLRISDPKLADWLSDPRHVATTRAHVRAIHAAGPIDVLQSSPEEGRQFIAVFFPGPESSPQAPNWKLRHAGIVLALRAMRLSSRAFNEDDGFVPLDVIRHAMGSRTSADGASLDITGVERAAACWTSVQLRQYFKAALETLFRVAEFEIHEATMSFDRQRGIQDIGAAIGNRVTDKLAATETTVAATNARFARGLPDNVKSLYQAGCEVAELNLGRRLTELVSASQRVLLTSRSQLQSIEASATNAATLAYEAFVYLAQDTAVWCKEASFNLLDEHDPLSFAGLREITAQMDKKPPGELIARVVCDYVLNQHFRIVRSRSTRDDKPRDAKPRDRYRFVMGDDGLERALSRERDLFDVPVLEDKLHRALNLLALSGVVEQRGDKHFRLTTLGLNRADEVIPRADAMVQLAVA